jgi:hypothetical protein
VILNRAEVEQLIDLCVSIKHPVQETSDNPFSEIDVALTEEVARMDTDYLDGGCFNL